MRAESGFITLKEAFDRYLIEFVNFIRPQVPYSRYSYRRWRASRYNSYRRMARKYGGIAVGIGRVRAIKLRGVWHVDEEELSRTIRNSKEAYKRLIEEGLDPGDARDILCDEPEAVQRVLELPLRELYEQLIEGGLDPGYARDILYWYGRCEPEAVQKALEFPLRKFRALVTRSRSKAKKRVLRRDGGRCVACGSKVRLQVHHILRGFDPCRDYFWFISLYARNRPKENPAELLERDLKLVDDPLNLVTLCEDCHRAVTPRASHLGLDERENTNLRKLILGEFRLRKWTRGRRVAEAVRVHMRKIYGDRYSERLRRLGGSILYYSKPNTLCTQRCADRAKGEAGITSG